MKHLNRIIILLVFLPLFSYSQYTTVSAYDFRYNTVLKVDTIYKITDAMCQNNPIFLRYGVDSAWHDGSIRIYNSVLDTILSFPVTYNRDNDVITTIEEPNWANKFEQNENTGFGMPNAVAVFINYLQYRESIAIMNNNKIGSAELNIYQGGASGSQFFYGNNIYDDNIITIGDSGYAKCLYTQCFWRNRLVLKNNADVRFLFLYNSADVTVGENTLISNARFYDPVTIVIPPNKIFNDPTKVYEAKPGWNSFPDEIYTGSSSSPNLTEVAWAGDIEIDFASTSQSFTSFTGLTEGFLYKVHVPAGKTATFTQGNYFKCLNATSFVCVGNNKDYFTFKIEGGKAWVQSQVKH